MSIGFDEIQLEITFFRYRQTGAGGRETVGEAHVHVHCAFYESQSVLF